MLSVIRVSPWCTTLLELAKISPIYHMVQIYGSYHQYTTWYKLICYINSCLQCMAEHSYDIQIDTHLSHTVFCALSHWLFCKSLPLHTHIYQTCCAQTYFNTLTVKLLASYPMGTGISPQG